MPMRLSERAIEFPRLILLGGVLLCALGFAGALTLPKERTPRVRLPVIVVAVPNPGATPDVNERTILRKLEDEIAKTIDGLRDEGAIISQSVHGAVVCQIIFDDGVDVDTALNDVRNLVNRIKGEFPPEAQSDPGPRISDIAFQHFPIIQIAVAGGADGVQRRRTAEQLEADIENIDGISGVDLFGGHEPEVQIEVNPHLLVHYGFNYADLMAAIEQSNQEVPTGEIRGADGLTHRVRMRPKLESIDQIRQVPVGQFDGKPIAVDDLAEVRLGHKPLESIARYDGEDAVVLLVRAKTDVDVLATAQAVQQVVDDFRPSDPSLTIQSTRSQAREINYMLSELGRSAVYGTMLVILILWVSLGWRQAVLIGTSVPLALLLTFAIMWLTKQSITPDLAINNMTLFAIILVVGMVVDGCIIVGENIYRHREMGASAVEAAKRGIGEVGPSLTCAYLTTFAAFGPMFVVRGVMGDFMKLLPIVVMYSLCAAMVVDHFVLPVLSVYLMKVRRSKRFSLFGSEPAADDDEPAPAVAQDETIDDAEVRAARAAGERSGLLRWYTGALRAALRHRFAVLAVTAVASLTPLGLYAVGAIGVEFFPEADYNIIEAYFELPQGSDMQKKTVEVARIIEDTAGRVIREEEWYRPDPNRPRVGPVTTVGDPGALNIRLDTEHGVGPEYGMVYIELVEPHHRSRSLSEIRQALKEAIPPLPDVVVDLRSPTEGPPVGAPIVVRLLGRESTSLALLERRAMQIEQLLREVPGTYDVKSDFRLRPEFVVAPDRMRAGLFDVTAAEIGTSVSFALEGVSAGEVDFGGDEQIDLRIRNQGSHRDQFEDLANLPLLSATGKRVIIEQVADVRRARAASVLRRYERQRAINIRCQVEDGVLVQDVLDQLDRDLATIDRLGPDEEPKIMYAGETEMRNDAMQDLMMAMGIAGGAMLVILVFKFNSFVQPLIVLSSVPLSLIGVGLALTIGGFNFSVAAMIGVVALSGIVVNDAIVLVDFINRLRGTGVPMNEAVVLAGRIRLRAIILTTLTTIAGLVPLSLNVSGGEFWRPLTVTLMSGLAFATLLQMFVIPLACYVFDRGERVSVLDPMKRPELAGA